MQSDLGGEWDLADLTDGIRIDKMISILWAWQKSAKGVDRQDICQQSRRARLAIDFSTGWACASHASDVLGACVMITSALLRTETERWREEVTISPPAWSYREFLGRLGMTTALRTSPSYKPCWSYGAGLPCRALRIGGKWPH